MNTKVPAFNDKSPVDKMLPPTLERIAMTAALRSLQLVAATADEDILETTYGFEEQERSWSLCVSGSRKRAKPNRKPTTHLTPPSRGRFASQSFEPVGRGLALARLMASELSQLMKKVGVDAKLIVKGERIT